MVALYMFFNVDKHGKAWVRGYSQMVRKEAAGADPEILKLPCDVDTMVKERKERTG
jgi:hypothetical protein